MSPPFNVFLTPSGKFEPSSVSKTLTSGLARGLGVHAVPLVDWRDERRRHAFQDWVRRVVGVHAGRHGRPVVGAEPAAPHELGEPRPRVCAEPGHVESEPAASVPDVALERQALRRRVRHVVQPDHDPYIPEIRVVQCVPIAGRGKRVAARLRGGAERPHRLLREQEVIELAAGREKRQHLRTCGLGLLREQGWRGKKGCCNAADRQ